MSTLRKLPVYIPLLPLFFVLHGYYRNFGYIHPGEALLLAGWYCFWCCIVFLALFAMYKDVVKAGLATFVLTGFYFFFGALHDSLKAHSGWLSKYSVMLPAFLLGSTIILVALKRTRRSLFRLNFFLNLLFIIYLVVDLAGVSLKSLRADGGKEQSSYPAYGNIPFTPCADCDKPDIYLLLFDAYSSSLALQEQYHYNNGGLDSFLTGQGFHIQRHSQANYKYTILSMPSILDMNYLDSLQYVKGGPVAEYLYLSDLIKHNGFMKCLSREGYETVNCSIFDLQGEPSPIEESLLPLQTRLITDQTLYSRLRRDLGWMLFQYIHGPFSDEVIYNSLHNNEKLIARLKEASAARAGHPRFIYAHLNMPHPPYYYDRNDNPKKVKADYAPTDEDDVPAYLDYVTYTNTVAKDLIGTIQKNEQGKAVILFMGDHGLRYHDRLGYNPVPFVQNQNAVYFPGKDYHLFYDSISGVNQLRVVLNTLFRQNIPFIKDSIVNVKDKE